MYCWITIASISLSFDVGTWFRRFRFNWFRSLVRTFRSAGWIYICVLISEARKGGLNIHFRFEREIINRYRPFLLACYILPRLYVHVHEHRIPYPTSRDHERRHKTERNNICFVSISKYSDTLSWLCTGADGCTLVLDLYLIVTASDQAPSNAFQTFCLSVQAYFN